VTQPNNSTQVSFRNARVTWSQELCGSCHEENKTHYFPGLWGASKHANTEVAINECAVESKTTTAGGAADPQSGAQFCSRCHSAQGFARYAQQLKNGATGRYDFITQDNQKLLPDGGNAPTAAWLSSIGLNAAQVEPQTCQSCHDPHSNGGYSPDGGVGPVDCSQQANYGNAACMQLRLYDTIPGLPNGQGLISGVGEGALCMACHNGRAGEHTEVKLDTPYAETPHDSTATEALFGFNMFFMPEYNPSPHLAIQDTCAGCHVKIPTAAEADAGYASNHEFSTDLSICQTCHGSSNVNGAAIQAQWTNEMATLGPMVQNAVVYNILAVNAANGLGTTVINRDKTTTTIPGNTALCVQVTSISNAACTGGSCKSTQVVPAVPFPLPASNVLIPAGDILPTGVTASAGSTTVKLALATAVSVPQYDPLDTGMLHNLGNVSLKSISVPIYTIVTAVGGACPSPATGTYVFPPSDVPAKAIWNDVELTNEDSKGIHNFGFTMDAISATEAKLAPYQGLWHN
jgi:hypothetical protein